MGFNILGIVLSKKFEDKNELCKSLGIGEVQLIEPDEIFENASSSYGMGDLDVYITEVGNGTLITHGIYIDFTTINVKPLTSGGGKGMRFVMGDTTGMYNYFYAVDGKGKRQFNFNQGKVIADQGEKLAVETEGKDVSSLIFDLIGEITGMSFWNIEPDHPALLYRKV